MDNKENQAIIDPESLPLCVDLDGTLINTDTLAETVIAGLHDRMLWMLIPIWLMQGKAKFKAKLARRVKINYSLIPYNCTLIEYLEDQRNRGRRLILTTAANTNIADAINNYLGLFHEVIASGESDNLRGARKAEVLLERFGDRGFSYAGNDRTDLHVWKYSYSAVLVNVSAGVSKQVARLTTITHRFNEKSSILLSFLRSIRLHQWVKNTLIFVPIITANAFHDLHALTNAFMLFIAFCITSSAIYLFNDLCDLEVDRNHPTKRNRPFASGALPISAGFSIIPMLLVIGFSVAFSIHVPFVTLLLLCYGVASITYSMKLKKFPLVDVFTLALLYTIRLFSGGISTGYQVSFWLMTYSGFFFLSLAMIKRVGELKGKPKNQQIPGRGYTTEDLFTMQAFGIASTFVSSGILALYIQSQAAAIVYTNLQILSLIVPLILFWQCRLWLATARGYMHDDPIVYTAKDWVSLLVGLLVALILLVARVEF